MLEIDEYSWLKGTLKYKLIGAPGRNRSEAIGYHPNGNPKFRYFLVNSELNGVGRFWDEGGRLCLEENFVNGQVNGIRREWYSNGNLESEEFYKSGSRNGISKSWYLDGRLKSQCTYLNDRRHGLALEWHTNGQLIERKSYESGLMNGVCMKWDEKGELKEKKIYVRGVIIPPKIQKIIDSGKLSAQYIIAMRNTALRRICLEEFGYERFLLQVNHEVISKDDDCELVRIDWHKREESIFLVKVRCPSTGVFYTLRVPPRMKTVKQAIAWTFNMKDSEYTPLSET
ncbi:MAG: toxin-antitoxin system YwqK family antitoxin [Candidatus Omnitrophota bacterium]